jgi:hypothetical protein
MYQEEYLPKMRAALTEATKAVASRCMLKRERLRHIFTYVLWLSYKPARPLF